MGRGLQISDSEWDVMEPIWAAGACTAADVIKQLSRRTIGITARSAPSWRGSWRRGRWRTTSTDRGTSTGPPSPANGACARKAARSWRRRSAATSRRCSPISSPSVAGSGPDRATPSIARPEERSQGETKMITLLDTLATGDLAGLLAGGGIGAPGRAALVVPWRTPVSAVAVSAVGCRPGAAAVRGDSRQSLERVQSGPRESAGSRPADRSAWPMQRPRPAPREVPLDIGPDETRR